MPRFTGEEPTYVAETLRKIEAWDLSFKGEDQFEKTMGILKRLRKVLSKSDVMGIGGAGGISLIQEEYLKETLWGRLFLISLGWAIHLGIRQRL